MCKNCGKEFYSYKTSGGKPRVFCSRACNHAWREGRTNTTKKKGIYKKCPICGKDFYCYPSEIKTKKTCSRACKYELERREGIRSGENCNFWHGGFDSYRGVSWYHQRKLALERDNNTCAICGKTAEEQGYSMLVHHIVPFRFFENDHKKANSLDNLICLCHNCHAKQESHHWHEVPEEYQYLLDGIEPQKKPPAGRRYTTEEVQYLRDNYKRKSYKEMAEELGRTENSIIDKIRTAILHKK